MPAKSVAQTHFFGAELARKRKGKKTQTGLGEATLSDFASTPTADLPLKVKKTAKKAK